MSVTGTPRFQTLKPDWFIRQTNSECGFQIHTMDLLKELGGDFTGVDGIRLDPTRLTTLETLLTQTFSSRVRVSPLQRFKSKKNVVFLLRVWPSGRVSSIRVVAKLFVMDRFDDELHILREGYQKGLAVPRVLGAQDGVILMSFIPGEALVERINRTFEPGLIDRLAEWYYGYHMALGRNKGDPRLRNFIISNGVIFGVDFEESEPGHWIADIGGISASLLDTEPVFDRRKRALAWRLLEKYLGLRGESRESVIDGLFIETVSNTLKQTAHWRRDDSLLALAKRVAAEGIPVD